MESPLPRRPPPPAAVSHQRPEHQSESDGGRLTLTAAAAAGAGVETGAATEGQPSVRRVTRPRGPGGSVPKRTPSRHPSPGHPKAKTTTAAGMPPASAARRPRHYTDPDQRAASVAVKATRPVKATPSSTSATPANSMTGKSTTGTVLTTLKTRGTVSGMSTPTSGLTTAAQTTRTSLLGSTNAMPCDSVSGVGTGLGAAPQASMVGVVSPRVSIPAPTTVAMVKMREPSPEPPLTPPLEEKVAAQKVVRAEAAAWAEAAAAQLAVAEAAEAVAKGAASRAVEEQKRAAAAQAMADRSVNRRLRVATCATVHTGPLQRDQGWVEVPAMKPATTKTHPQTATGSNVRPSRGPSKTRSKTTAKSTPMTSKQSLAQSSTTTTGVSVKTRISTTPVLTAANLTATSTTGTTGATYDTDTRGDGFSTTGVSADSVRPPKGRVWEALGVEATAAQRRAARRMAWAASQRTPMPKQWADLPKEVLLRIFMYFPEKELASRLSLVCRPWRQAARHPLLWRQLSFRGDRVSIVVINRLLRTSPKLHSLRLDAVPDAPTVIRQLCRCNTDVRTVIVRDCTFGKDEVIPESVFRNLIMCCPKISKLDLQGTQFSALRFFQDIIKLPSLRSLNVGDNRFLKVQDLMALSLNCQGLQQLQVARRPARPPFPQLTDHDVQYMFTHLKDSLVALAFDCAGLGDSSLRAILKCTQLKKLELNNARDFSGRELRRIGERLHSLTKLKLTHACQMRTPDFRALFCPIKEMMPRATSDDANDASMIEEELAPTWSVPLRGLVKVDLRSCWAMEDEGLRAVVDANYKTLDSLSVKGCQTITSAGLKYVVDHCANLRHLNVAFALTQGSALDPLLEAHVALPKLRRLVVDMAHRRSAVLPRLKQRMPILLILGSFSEYSEDESVLNFVTSFDQHPHTPLVGLLTTNSSSYPLPLNSVTVETKEEKIL